MDYLQLIHLHFQMRRESAFGLQASPDGDPSEGWQVYPAERASL